MEFSGATISLHRFPPVDSVAGAPQDFREFAAAHAAESSGTAPTTETCLRLYEFLRRAVFSILSECS
jgi:hypothetical protein